MARRVRCSITFYYGEETYADTWYEEMCGKRTDKDILRYCKELMMEDINDYQNPVNFAAIKAKFEEV